jgi:phenylalanyl-tRNA synthetase beta chain
MGVKFSFEENSSGTFTGGRQAKILSDGKDVGMMGEISPAVLEKWGLEMPCAAFEINLDSI